MPITAFYAGLLAFLYVILSFRVILFRVSKKIVLGDGGERYMERRIRVHANFIEYVPIAVLLMALFESVGGEQFFVHVLGGTLLVARISHAIGVSREPDIMILRRFGMVLTFFVIISGAILCIGAPFGR